MTAPVDRTEFTKSTPDLHKTSSERLGRKFERQGGKVDLWQSTGTPVRTADKVRDIDDVLAIGRNLEEKK